MFTYAFHAHNQVLQTVSMGGGLALIGLLVYVWLLVRYSIRAASSTKGVSVALLLILLLRSLTEVPLPQHAHFSLDFLMHIVFFMILVLNARQTTHQQANSEMSGSNRTLTHVAPVAG
jgi:multisubunit Na+/H+ antiporter MnhE subunit